MTRRAFITVLLPMTSPNVATLPCETLMSCSQYETQGSVATHLRCGVIFTATLQVHCSVYGERIMKSSSFDDKQEYIPFLTRSLYAGIVTYTPSLEICRS